MQHFPTSHKGEANEYPYGRLRTTAYFGTEFKKGKGFRSTFQTINPKTGRLNAVKVSTYYPVMLMRLDAETGHYKHSTMNPNSNEGVNKTLDFVRENFELFTPDELKEIAAHLLAVTKAGMQAIITYCGADKDKVLEVGTPGYKALLHFYKEPTFDNLQAVHIDAEGMEALKVEGYNPWVITER